MPVWGSVELAWSRVNMDLRIGGQSERCSARSVRTSLLSNSEPARPLSTRVHEHLAFSVYSLNLFARRWWNGPALRGAVLKVESCIYEALSSS